MPRLSLCVGGLHEHGEAEAAQRVVAIVDNERRERNAARMGDVFHELLRRVVEAEAWTGVGQAEGVERPDDVGGGHVPVEIAFAEVDENVVRMNGGGFAELAVRGRFPEEQMIDAVAGEKGSEIAGGS